jgi:hypothetical protein
MLYLHDQSFISAQLYKQIQLIRLLQLYLKIYIDIIKKKKLMISIFFSTMYELINRFGWFDLIYIINQINNIKINQTKLSYRVYLYIY